MTAETFENSSFGPVSESGITDGLSGIHSHFKSRNYDKKRHTDWILEDSNKNEKKLAKTTGRL